MFWRTWTIALFVGGIVGSSDLEGANCLADAIVEGKRKYIQDDNGNDIPVGVLVCNWKTSVLMSDMMKIFVEEVLGYHAEFKSGCTNGAHPIYALGGCTDFASNDLRSCGQETEIHISLDSWIGSYADQRKTFAKDYPALTPDDLGSMGYDGEESIYLSKAVIDSAYADVGLPLLFYMSYNASVHTPSKYFDKLSDVNPMELALCSESEFTTSPDMNLYVQFSGDYDGMTQQADGSYAAKCPDGRWWPAPGCRNDLTKCIPVITAFGWKLQAIMQWMTAYNFPAAVGMYNTYGNFTKNVASAETLHYWWVPDATFIERRPEPVIFPRHSPSEWAAGDKKTGGTGTYIAKMVSSNLQTKASFVRDFVAQITLELSEVMYILLEQKQSGASDFQTMCEWVKRQKDRWEDWVPDVTKCAPQFGLYRAEDNVFVTNRLNPEGITCRACPSGHFSAELTDLNGTTFVCKPCAAGTSQASGAALRCDPCPHGEYQDEEGQSSCKRCDQGKYQSLEGQKQCITCPNGTTTLGFSSLDLSDCGCTNHKINLAGQGSGIFDCLPCSNGLNCQFPSTVQNLLDGLEGQTFATIQPGYFSTEDNPTSMYRCEPASYCLGGRPGECAGGLTGVPCAICPNGQTWSDSKCVACGESAWALPLGILFLVAIFLFHYIGNAKVRKRATTIKLAAIAAGLTVNVLQTVALMGMMTVVWSVDMEETSSGLSFMVLDIQSFGVSCFVGSNPVNMYTGTAILIPLVLTWVVLCRLFTSFLPERLASYRWQWRGTFNLIGILLQAGFSTMSAVVLQPMMCYQHPNGVKSLLKYPNVVCGESEQATMLGISWGLGSIFIVAFYVVCIYAAIRLPKCSGKPAFSLSFRLSAGFGDSWCVVEFLYSNFRQDRWWFGLLTMARGFCFALVIAVATDAPEAQSTLATLILVIYGFAQAVFWPWKAAVVNLADMLLSALLLLLAASTQVKQIESTEKDPTEWTFERFFTFLILLAIAACVIILSISICTALVFQLLGDDFRKISAAISDLRTWDSGKMTAAMKACAESLVVAEPDRLAKGVNVMNHYDLQVILDAITVIHSELLLEGVATLQINSQRLTLAASKSELEPPVAEDRTPEEFPKDESSTTTTEDEPSDIAAVHDDKTTNPVVEDEGVVEESDEIYFRAGYQVSVEL